MTLWPHQQFALDELGRLRSEACRRICVASPTGGGKSRILFEDLAKQKSAAVYTDRRMLLSQLSEGLRKNGFQFGVRAAGIEPRLLDDFQLCMVQTETSRVNKGRDIHPARTIYIDELHKNSGESMQMLVEKHRKAVPDCTIVGLTATPLGVGHMVDELITAGTVSELRKCGALVPAYHYGPDEPDQKWVGKIAVGEGECGLPNKSRMEYAQRVFGSVVEHYRELNPEQRPSILFAPGVAESIWFAEHLSEQGIPAAHIDGQNVWLDGWERKKTDEIIEEIAQRSRDGDLKVVCNRFVLREGINWPWLWHCIWATVFGSLTSFIQSGGRMLRADSGKTDCCIQDHGGNWWRHGSLNTDREWQLELTDAIAAGERERRIRERKEPEPITCPRCHAIRLSGPECYTCGYRHEGKRRPVLQKDGTLKEAKGDIFRKRRYLEPTDESMRKAWESRVNAVRRSKKPTVQSMTFAQLEASFARDNRFQYPQRSWPGMPVNNLDMYSRVNEVPANQLIQNQPQGVLR